MNSFSWDDPLDDVSAGLVGMAWGAVWARAGKVPVLLGGGESWRATARLLALVVLFAVASSLLMAQAWHTRGGFGGAGGSGAGPALEGLLAYACAWATGTAVVGWAHTRHGAEELLPWGGNNNKARYAARRFWGAFGATSFGYGVVFATTTPATRDPALAAWMFVSCALARATCVCRCAAAGAGEAGRTSSAPEAGVAGDYRRVPPHPPPHPPPSLSATASAANQK